jgi:hypothetical protein
MATSFLLRFQELCEESRAGEVTAALQSVTKIQREQGDLVSTEDAFKTLVAGTSTCTRVRSEQTDNDYANPSRTFPIAHALGTRTKTAVKKETEDQDPCHQQMRVFPKCY